MNWVFFFSRFGVRSSPSTMQRPAVVPCAPLATCCSEEGHEKMSLWTAVSAIRHRRLPSKYKTLNCVFFSEHFRRVLFLLSFIPLLIHSHHLLAHWDNTLLYTFRVFEYRGNEHYACSKSRGVSTLASRNTVSDSPLAGDSSDVFDTFLTDQKITSRIPV